MAVSVTYSGKYKQNVLYFKLLRVENITQSEAVHNCFGIYTKHNA